MLFSPRLYTMDLFWVVSKACFLARSLKIKTIKTLTLIIQRIKTISQRKQNKNIIENKIFDEIWYAIDLSILKAQSEISFGSLVALDGTFARKNFVLELFALIFAWWKVHMHFSIKVHFRSLYDSTYQCIHTYIIKQAGDSVRYVCSWSIVLRL